MVLVFSVIAVKAQVQFGISKLVFSWTVGCGWLFKSGIGINARSQWGISSIIKDQSGLTNSGFNATVFYLFPSGKK
ncbi:MAG TPA: hypothetical protein VE035_01530 [Puia sp.]|nr:hypothetical protein [Puia sp.]